MCRLASGFVQPIESLPVRVWNLEDHSATMEKLGLKDGDKPNGWREWHYLPGDPGEISVNVLPIDALSATQCVAGLRARWPRFVDFLAWAWGQGVLVPQTVGLDGLTSAKGLVLPQGVQEVWLDGLTSAKGLVLPQGVQTVWLDGLPEGERKTVLVQVKNAH